MKILPEIDYKNLFESVPGLYLVLLPDPDFTIVAVSDAYAEATLTKREEIIGKGLFEVFPDNPDDPGADGVSNLRQSLQAAIKTKSVHTMSVQKYDIRTQDGHFETRYWSPKNKPLLDKKGKVVLIVHRVEDVTDYVSLQNEQLKKEQLTDDLRQRVGQMENEVYRRSEEIKQKNEELIETNINLESFTYSVSHDLRAPLRAIDGYAHVLEEDYSAVLDDEAKRLLSHVQYNAKQMGILIDELLEFSKLGRKELQKTVVDVKKLAGEVVADLQRTVGEYSVVKIENIHSVEADYVLLRQVMVNLISNALKYSSKSPNPIVIISSEVRNGETVFSIKDNGVGFNMAYVSKLFGVFQRLHSREEFEGTGVGLAIVKKIIEKHEGRIWAESVPGEGASFFFALPATDK